MEAFKNPDLFIDHILAEMCPEENKEKRLTKEELDHYGIEMLYEDEFFIEYNARFD